MRRGKPTQHNQARGHEALLGDDTNGQTGIPWHMSQTQEAVIQGLKQRRRTHLTTFNHDTVDDPSSGLQIKNRQARVHGITDMVVRQIQMHAHAHGRATNTNACILTSWSSGSGTLNFDLDFSLHAPPLKRTKESTGDKTHQHTQKEWQQEQQLRSARDTLNNCSVLVT